eukprot:scaffold1644_cov357-Prasinococcus_capsulatus_cf.AAC.5
MVVRLHRGEPQLRDEAVHLVDEQGHLQPLLPGLRAMRRMRTSHAAKAWLRRTAGGPGAYAHLAENGPGLDAHALGRVHEDHGTIADAYGAGDLAAKVHVPGGVYHVDQVVVRGGRTLRGLPRVRGSPLGIHKRDGGGLHCDAALLLVLTAVQVAQLTGLARVDDAIGGDKDIREGGLAVVDVRDNAQVTHEAGTSLDATHPGRVEEAHCGRARGGRPAGHTPLQPTPPAQPRRECSAPFGAAAHMCAGGPVGAPPARPCATAPTRQGAAGDHWGWCDGRSEQRRPLAGAGSARERAATDGARHATTAWQGANPTMAISHGVRTECESR